MLGGAHNLLYEIKQLVVGSGKPDQFGATAADGGFLLDFPLSLGDATLGASTTFITDSQGLRALSQAVSTASTVAIGTWGWLVPRDYDLTTDKFLVRISAAMNGATDTPTLTLTSSTLLPAGVLNAQGVLNTTTTLVAGSTVVGSTATGGGPASGSPAVTPYTYGSTLSSTQTIFEFPMSNLGLMRDSVVSLRLNAGPHTTNTVIVYFVEIIYASCAVAFNDQLVQAGKNLGVDVFGVPLR